ncbi:MAG TPA: acyltransferase [Chitinophagaceae bacterium]|nr:acyltransferase [Chitinophagaceae bacterium]
MPFRISRRCSLVNLKGNLIIESQIQPGMIQIGYGDVGVFDNKKERAIWNVRGKIIFRGKCYLGNGIKLNVTETGVLTFGNNVNFTAKSAIDCQKDISFGDNCLVSWENLFIDGDYHKIFDAEGKYTNPPQSIIIGNHVWFGCRCLILKGVTIANDCVVAAGSLLNGNYTVAKSIIAGSPAKTVKENITWQI